MVGGAAKDGDLAIGGEEIEVAALDVAQDHADRGDGLGGGVLAFDGDADSDALERRAEVFELGLGGIHGSRAFQGFGIHADDTQGIPVDSFTSSSIS